MRRIVSLAAVFSIVTQRGALRDDTKNGCVGDYAHVGARGYFGRDWVERGEDRGDWIE